VCRVSSSFNCTHGNQKQLGDSATKLGDSQTIMFFMHVLADMQRSTCPSLASWNHWLGLNWHWIPLLGDTKHLLKLAWHIKPTNHGVLIISGLGMETS
jgi:hypothetical protein